MIPDYIIQILMAFLCTLGFGFLFNVRGIKIVYAALGGMMSWIIFLALGLVIDSEPIRYFIVSVCTTTYSEILARVLKTPSSTFSIITLIPLIPGGALYYTTTYALNRNIELFLPKFISTIELSVSLSLGIVIVTAVSRKVFIRKKA